MRVKTDWLPYLHELRRRELDIIFSRCPAKLFRSGLEIGAGDGFQSSILSKYAVSLLCSDYHSDILEREPRGSTQFRVCDAEQIGETFGERQFDLVFSSNLLEHVPRPGKVLAAIHSALVDHGVTIHVVPNRFWKLCHVTLRLPNLLVELLEQVSEQGLLPTARRKLARLSRGGPVGGMEPDRNNPKTPRGHRPLLARILLPVPHGVSTGNLAELAAFSRARWERLFEEAGFRLAAVLRAPVASGYGFGFDRIRNLLERCGLSSGHIYIATKQGAESPFLRYLASPSGSR